MRPFLVTVPFLVIAVIALTVGVVINVNTGILNPIPFGVAVLACAAGLIVAERIKRAETLNSSVRGAR